MTGVVEGFRWALLGKGEVGALLWISVCIVIVLLASGLAYFRRMEASFADVI
jgi:lipopolysaccharide transport system permease protein